MRLALIGSLLFFMGCKSPCEQYIDAVETCAEAAGSTSDGDSDGTDYCADDDGSSDDLYTCMADAYNEGDCSTTDGLFEAAIEAASCASAGDSGE